MQGWLEDGDAVVFEHVEELVWVRLVGVCDEDLESLVLTVVLPALSRPRKSSLACLLARPKLASMSQTGEGVLSAIVYS